MLTREESEFLSKQLQEYKYNQDTVMQANEVLTNVLDELKTTFAMQGNILAYHDSRIKTPNSFLNKVLKTYGTKEEVSYDDMHDIVGHRIVCLNLSDVNKFIELLEGCDKIRIIEPVDNRNYIKTPKKSGYRSHHIIIEVPFIDKDGVEQAVKAEIQLRTILMDVFAREEHKLSYKNNGVILEEDRVELKQLADELYFYDLALDRMIKPKKDSDLVDPEELELIKQEFSKAKNLYDIIYRDLGKMINDYCKEYNKKADILHITSRIKPISSIRRKLVKKGLKYSSDDIVYKLNDVVGFKIVCTDESTVRDFIDYINPRIEESDLVKLNHPTNFLDTPKKETGYRGYKMNVDFCPQYLSKEPITTEIIIRTMIQDAWALQHDARAYNKEECYNSLAEYTEVFTGLRGLSHTLHRVEMALNELKEKNNENTAPARNIVKEVKEYNKTKKLLLEKKDEE